MTAIVSIMLRLDSLSTTAATLSKTKLTVAMYAIAYLWELCYDLLLAMGENASASSGFGAYWQSFGGYWLRLNR